MGGRDKRELERIFGVRINLLGRGRKSFHTYERINRTQHSSSLIYKRRVKKFSNIVCFRDSFAVYV